MNFTSRMFQMVLVFTFVIGLTFSAMAQTCVAPSQADWLTVMTENVAGSETITYAVGAHPFYDYVSIGGSYSGSGLSGTSLPSSTVTLAGQSSRDGFMSLLHGVLGTDLLDVSLPGASSEGVASIEYASNGSLVYVTSYQHDSVLFELNILFGVFVGSMSDLIFPVRNGTAISRLDQYGNYLGSHRFEGINSSSEVGVIDINIANTGEIFVLGGFYGLVDFDPAGSSDLRTASNFGEGMFVTKFNADGSYAWTYTPSLPNTTFMKPRGLASDSSGNIYFVGSASGLSQFLNFGPGVLLQSVSSNAGFVVKLDPLGVPVSGWLIQGNGTSTVDGIAIDSSDNIYLAGVFSFTSEFAAVNQGVSSFSHSATSSPGERAMYVARYSSQLQPQWFNQESTSLPTGNFFNIELNKIQINGCGQIVVSGNFVGQGYSTIGSSIGSRDAFLSKYDSFNGNVLWGLAYTGGAGLTTFPTDMDFIGNGDMVVVGKRSTPSSSDLFTFRLSDNANPGTPGCDCI